MALGRNIGPGQGEKYYRKDDHDLEREGGEEPRPGRMCPRGPSSAVWREDLVSGTAGSVPAKEKMRLGAVDCEICGSDGLAKGEGHGVHICAACHRDIVSPHHIHD